MLVAIYIIRTAVIFTAICGMAVSVLADGGIPGDPFAFATFGSLAGMTFMWAIDRNKSGYGIAHVVVQVVSFVVAYVALYLVYPYIVAASEMLGDFNYGMTFASIVALATVFSSHIEAAEQRGAKVS